MSEHAVVILGLKRKGVIMRERVQCACGATLSCDAPEGWYERCAEFLVLDPKLRLGANWTPEWIAERAAFRKAHGA